MTFNKLAPVRNLFIAIITVAYSIASSIRQPDSDYEAYIEFFDIKDAIGSCYFEPGFCYLVWGLNYLELPAILAYGAIYCGLLSFLCFYYSRLWQNGMQIFIGVILLLIFLGLINNYYMAFHLYRQNISVMIFAIAISALANPIFAYLVAALFHLSFLAVMPLYFLIKYLDLSVRKSWFKLMLICLFGYVISPEFSQLLQNLAVINLDFIAVRADIYSNHTPTGTINSIPLFIYLFGVLTFARTFLCKIGKLFDIIFYTSVSALVLACFSNFNELISYRFLVVAKGLSLPLMFLAIPYKFEIKLQRFLCQKRKVVSAQSN